MSNSNNKKFSLYKFLKQEKRRAALTNFNTVLKIVCLFLNSYSIIFSPALVAVLVVCPMNEDSSAFVQFFGVAYAMFSIVCVFYNMFVLLSNNNEIITRLDKHIENRKQYKEFSLDYRRAIKISKNIELLKPTNNSDLNYLNFFLKKYFNIEL